MRLAPVTIAAAALSAVAVALGITDVVSTSDAALLLGLGGVLAILGTKET